MLGNAFVEAQLTNQSQSDLLEAAVDAKKKRKKKVPKSILDEFAPRNRGRLREPESPRASRVDSDILSVNTEGNRSNTTSGSSDYDSHHNGSHHQRLLPMSSESSSLSARELKARASHAPMRKSNSMRTLLTGVRGKRDSYKKQLQQRRSSSPVTSRLNWTDKPIHDDPASQSLGKKGPSSSPHLSALGWGGGSKERKRRKDRRGHNRDRPGFYTDSPMPLRGGLLRRPTTPQSSSRGNAGGDYMSVSSGSAASGSGDSNNDGQPPPMEISVEPDNGFMDPIDPNFMASSSAADFRMRVEAALSEQSVGGSSRTSRGRGSPSMGDLRSSRGSPSMNDLRPSRGSPSMGELRPSRSSPSMGELRSSRSSPSLGDAELALSHREIGNPSSQGGDNFAPRGPSLVEAMLENEDDCDVVLIGKQGVQVPAEKHSIGFWLPSLQERFDDPTQDTSRVYMGEYKGDVLLALKEYCNTGGITKSTLATKRTAGSAKGIVELADLAKKYDVPNLYDDADHMVRDLLMDVPLLACAIYEAAHTEHTHELRHVALTFIRERSPDLLLVTPSLRHVGGSRLARLMEDLMLSDDITFRALGKWVGYHGRSRENMKVAGKICTKLNIKALCSDPIMKKELEESGFMDKASIEQILYNRRPPPPPIPPTNNGIHHRKNGNDSGPPTMVSTTSMVITTGTTKSSSSKRGRRSNRASMQKSEPFKLGVAVIEECEEEEEDEEEEDEEVDDEYEEEEEEEDEE